MEMWRGAIAEKWGVMLRVDRVRVLGVGTKGTMVVCVSEGGQHSGI